jgi:hypothetical protein
MQDEPELRPGFSHKMSLKGRHGMLRIDHQNGRFSCDNSESAGFTLRDKVFAGGQFN